MDKYEERVAKILEKKKNLDMQKKEKTKTLMQCLCAVTVLSFAIAAFVFFHEEQEITVSPEKTSSNVASVTYTESQKHTDPFASKPFIPLPNEWGCGGDDIVDTYSTKYRRIYYTDGSTGLNVFFANLVSDEEYEKWWRQYYEKHPTGDGMFIKGEEIVEPTRMKIVDFIMYFDIPRDKFEEANNMWCHSRMIKWGHVPVMNPKDYKEQEEFEVFNVDILYTFDDEIINAYYERGEYPFDTEEEYLDAVENDGYITQTKEFIMLEGFEKVTLPALPSDANPTWIDYDWRSKRCK